MKNIKYTLIIILPIIIFSKTISNENKVYKFSSYQNDEFTDIDSDKISSDKINIDFFFNIYSTEGKYNKGWILLYNFEKNKKNYIENIKKDKNEIFYIEDNNYELIPSLINIEDFEEPNFLISDFSVLKKKNKVTKLKYINDYPLIKFSFTKNGIVKIYKPSNMSDLDMFDLVQFLNKIIIKHRDYFFLIKNYLRKVKLLK